MTYTNQTNHSDHIWCWIFLITDETQNPVIRKVFHQRFHFDILGSPQLRHVACMNTFLMLKERLTRVGQHLFHKQSWVSVCTGLDWVAKVSLLAWDGVLVLIQILVTGAQRDIWQHAAR